MDQLEEVFQLEAVAAVQVIVAAEAGGARKKQIKTVSPAARTSVDFEKQVFIILYIYYRREQGRCEQEFVDKAERGELQGAPKMVREGVKKEEAEEMKKKLEAAGATVEIQ